MSKLEELQAGLLAAETADDLAFAEWERTMIIKIDARKALFDFLLISVTHDQMDHDPIDTESL